MGEGQDRRVREGVIEAFKRIQAGFRVSCVCCGNSWWGKGRQIRWDESCQHNSSRFWGESSWENTWLGKDRAGRDWGIEGINKIQAGFRMNCVFHGNSWWMKGRAVRVGNIWKQHSSRISGTTTTDALWKHITHSMFSKHVQN